MKTPMRRRMSLSSSCSDVSCSAKKSWRCYQGSSFFLINTSIGLTRRLTAKNWLSRPHLSSTCSQSLLRLSYNRLATNASWQTSCRTRMCLTKRYTHIQTTTATCRHRLTLHWSKRTSSQWVLKKKPSKLSKAKKSQSKWICTTVWCLSQYMPSVNKSIRSTWFCILSMWLSWPFVTARHTFHRVRSRLVLSEPSSESQTR